MQKVRLRHKGVAIIEAFKEKLIIAKIHELLITKAMKVIGNMVPLTAEKVSGFTFPEVAAWELLTNRFAKLTPARLKKCLGEIFLNLQ